MNTNAGTEGGKENISESKPGKQPRRKVNTSGSKPRKRNELFS